MSFPVSREPCGVGPRAFGFSGDEIWEDNCNSSRRLVFCPHVPRLREVAGSEVSHGIPVDLPFIG